MSQYKLATLGSDGKILPSQIPDTSYPLSATAPVTDGLPMVAPVMSGYETAYLPPAAAFLFWTRFTVRQPITVSKAVMYLQYPGTDDNPMSVSIYRYVPTNPAASQLDRIATTGSKTGMLTGSIGNRVLSFSASATLVPNVVYYYAVGLPNLTGSTKPNVYVQLVPNHYRTGLIGNGLVPNVLCAYTQFGTDAQVLNPAQNFNPSLLVNWVYPLNLSLQP